MKKIIPNVGSRFTFTFSSMKLPEEVPKEAVKHKLEKNRAFEIELLSQPEMRDLRNRFRRQLSRRGVSAENETFNQIFDQVMKKIGGKIDKDFNKRGVGHVFGEDRRFGDGRNSQEWFYVVDWPAGSRIREQLGFGDTDFHITLGMTGNGVDEISKDRSTVLDKREKEKLSKNEDGLTTLFVDDDDDLTNNEE